LISNTDPYFEFLNEEYLFFCDVETTGFDPIRNDIVSVAMVVTDKNMNWEGEFYQTLRPEFNKFYSAEAEKIHGFNKKQMLEFPHPRKTLIELLKFLNRWRSPGQWHPFIFHALRGFDFKFLEWAFRKQELHWSFFKMFDERFTQSTISMARSAGYSGNKLNEWADRLDFGLDHHNALSDTKCCAEVYGFLRQENGLE